MGIRVLWGGRRVCSTSARFLLALPRLQRLNHPSPEPLPWLFSSYRVFLGNLMPGLSLRRLLSKQCSISARLLAHTRVIPQLPAAHGPWWGVWGTFPGAEACVGTHLPRHQQKIL